MASPQKEKGSTMIANEVLEKIYSFPFTTGELRVLLFIIRKTWGWHKKEDKISYGQIVNSTKISRRNAIYVVSSLVQKQALVVKKGSINTISFNKDYEKWVVPKIALVQNSVLPSARISTTLVQTPSPKLVLNLAPTKDNKDTITKETIQKKGQRTYDLLEEDFVYISDKYKVPLNMVKLAKEEMDNWLEAKGKNYVGYHGYKAGLRNWVLRDAKKMVEGRWQNDKKRGIDAEKILRGMGSGSG